MYISVLYTQCLEANKRMTSQCFIQFVHSNMFKIKDESGTTLILIEVRSSKHLYTNE
jgi:hypothetical protein